MQLTVNFSHDAKAQDSQRAAAARLRPQRPEEAQSAISTAWLRPSFQIQDGPQPAAATGTPIRKRHKHVNKSPNSHAKLILDWAQLPEKGPDRRQAVAKVCEEHNVSPSYPPKLTKRVANSHRDSR